MLERILSVASEKASDIMAAISFFEMTLLRRDVNKWEGTRQEMEMTDISLPKERPGVLSPISTSETLCYEINDLTLQNLENDLIRQAPVRWERQIKLRIWSRSWSKVLKAWQSFYLTQQFAIMIDGKKFADSDDLAAAANEVAVYGGCDFPYFEPPRFPQDQFWHMDWCYSQIYPLIEWCQYHRKMLQNAALALRKFRSAAELRALLPVQFGRWTWSQVRMTQLLMPCGLHSELVNAVTALFQPVKLSLPRNMTPPATFELQCVLSSRSRDKQSLLECQERYASLRAAWWVQNLRELDEERRLDKLVREFEQSLCFEDDDQYLPVQRA